MLKLWSGQQVWELVFWLSHLRVLQGCLTGSPAVPALSRAAAGTAATPQTGLARPSHQLPVWRQEVWRGTFILGWRQVSQSEKKYGKSRKALHKGKKVSQFQCYHWNQASWAQPFEWWPHGSHLPYDSLLHREGDIQLVPELVKRQVVLGPHRSRVQTE